MNSSNFLKAVALAVFGLFFFSCQEKPSISLISIELIKEDSFDMDIVVNLKEGYLLHKKHFMVHIGRTSLPPNVFDLTKEQTDSLAILYKAIKVTEEKQQGLSENMLLTYVEAIEGDKIIAQRRQNSKRTEEEKLFLKRVLNLIAVKSKAPNTPKEIADVIKEL